MFVQSILSEIETKVGWLPPASLAESFAAAVRHHREGRLDDAIRLYGDVLAGDPGHGDSLHLLGVVGSQMGQHDLAGELIRQAIALNDQVVSYHCSLGNVRAAQGRLEEAVDCFRAAIGLNTEIPALHFNLGNILSAQRLLAAAAASYRRAIDIEPDYPEALNNLGNALMEQGCLDEAIASYRGALDIKSDYFDAWYNMAMALGRQGRLDEAVGCGRQALALRPDHPEAHNHLGTLLIRQGRLDEAVDCCRTAIALRPEYANGHYNLGNALIEQGRIDPAIGRFQRAIALKPDFAEAYNNLGNARRDLRQLDDAISAYRAALEVRPDYREAHNNLGTSLMEQGRLAEAAVSYRRAIVLNPDDAAPHANLATVLLAQGDMTDGFKEYEWRWQMPQMAKGRRGFAQPQWRGEAAGGRTLLIHAEQGYGDTLQFCRYATLAAAAGMRVFVEVPKPLVRLLRGLAGVARLIERGAELPTFDLHCPMLSLPLALGTTLATIPGKSSYLQADAAQAAAWRARLATATGPRIGLVWAGDPGAQLPAKAAVDRRRSLCPAQLAPLVATPGMRFFSLQKSGPAPVGLPVVDVMEEMSDFADTASLIANLDLVISVDTAVAHLAAALGKPVWLLDRFDTCWRWLSGRRDSPWYPSLRIYRQTRPGDWDTVLAEVSRDLRAWSR